MKIFFFFSFCSDKGSEKIDYYWHSASSTRAIFRLFFHDHRSWKYFSAIRNNIAGNGCRFRSCFSNIRRTFCCHFFGYLRTKSSIGDVIARRGLWNAYLWHRWGIHDNKISLNHRNSNKCFLRRSRHSDIALCCVIGNMSIECMLLYRYNYFWLPLICALCRQLRNYIVSICVTLSWIFTIILHRLCDVVLHEFGREVILYWFCLNCVLGACFVIFYIPETKRMSLLEVCEVMKEWNCLWK